MRRRGVGVGAIQKVKEEKKKYEEISDKLLSIQLKDINENLNIFKNKLQDFALRYKKDIRKNPIFRHQFHQMCSMIGVDPLASNKGFWSELLGFGDFYYELSIQIIDICIATRKYNGGFIKILDILNILDKRRGDQAQKINEEDIKTSIKKIKILGEGFRFIDIGGQAMIITVPLELHSDHTILLELSNENGGILTIDFLQKKLKWDKTRIEIAIDYLLKEEILWIDYTSPFQEINYYIPSVFISPSME